MLNVVFLLLFLLLIIGLALAEDFNVVGSPLESCSVPEHPVTGWFRDGFCRPDANDHGAHLLCAAMDDRFLDFTASRGNNLRSVVAAGQFWCLCVNRWKEAASAGLAPRVKLEATHSNTLSSFGLTLGDLHNHDEL